MKYPKLIVNSMITISFNAIASSSISMHISESGTITTKKEPTIEQTYLTHDSFRQLNPQNKADVNQLANSTEFEVYSISENSKTHTLFTSGAGVCYGYYHRGVDITDSATYYINADSRDEYYANLSGGTLDAKGNTQKVQYASVFNIQNPELSKQFREQELKYGKNIAEQNLKDRVNVLANVICQQHK